MTKQERITHIQKINASGLTTQAKLVALKSFVEQEKKADEEEKKNQDKLDVELKDLVKTLTETEKKETQFIGVLQGKPGKDSEVPGPKGEVGEKGEPGKDGLNGKDGKAGKNGKDGRDGIDGKDGKDGIVKTEIIVQEVLKVVNDTKSKVKLHIKNIDGVSELQDRIVNHAVTQARGLLYAGLLSSPSSGTGGYTVETPTGTVDGANTSFTVTATPVYIVSDGTTYFANNGFTISGLTITMSVPPTGYIRSFHA